MRRGRGEWIEEGKGREVEDDKGQGLRREWMENTSITTLTTTADSNGFWGLCTKAKTKIHLSLDLKIHSGAGVE